MADSRNLSRRDLIRAAALLPAASGLAAVLSACGGSDSPQPQADTPPGEPAPKPAPPRAQAPANPPAPPPAAPAAGEADTRLVTEIPSVAPQVQALQYVARSAKPDQNCANCLFYTAGASQQGRCQLFPQGLVAQDGWCVSWSAKV